MSGTRPLRPYGETLRGLQRVLSDVMCLIVAICHSNDSKGCYSVSEKECVAIVLMWLIDVMRILNQKRSMYKI